MAANQVTPEQAFAIQNIMPQGPMPTPAGNGYAAWAADPQNSQKIINSLVPPGQSIMPAPPPAPMSPATPAPAMPYKLFHWTPPNLPPQNPKGQTSPGNINVLDRPIVHNPDGSSSTVRSMSYGDDRGEHLIPTVSDGADGRAPHVMGNKEAIAYAQRTGQNLGNFDNPNDATAYAQSLHLQQAGMGNFGGRTSMPPQMTSEDLQAPTLPQGNPMGGNPAAPQPYAPYAQPNGSAPMPTASAIMPPSMQGQAPDQKPPLDPPGAQAPAPNQIPQIQSYKDWAGANPTMLDTASLKGRGAGRVAGGALIAGLLGASSGLKGDGQAGVNWAQGQVEHDRNLTSINQGRYNAAVVEPAKAQLALQDTNSQISQRNAAAAKSTAQAGAIGDDTKTKAKTVDDAAKIGMKPVYDENGKLSSFEPDKDSPIAKKQAASLQLSQAQIGNTQAQQELRTAQTELAKSKNDPNSASYKLAMSRLAVARQNASTASQRLNLSTQAFMMRSRGTDMQGNPLPGAMIGDDDQAIGSAFQQNVRPTGTERNKGDMAASADEQLHDIKQIMQKHKDMFGPGYGQSSQFLQWIGSQDPDAQRFVAARTIAADHLAGTFGGRSEAALTALDNAIGQFKDNPTAAIAGVDQLTKANKRFEKAGTVRTQGSNFNKQQTPGSAMANPPASGGGSLPPQAAAQLQEGVAHTFNNGQTWTKKNGTPVRVQ